MKKITIELSLTDGEWEELERRAAESYPLIRNELHQIDEDISFTRTDAIENEIRYIVSKSLEA